MVTLCYVSEEMVEEIMSWLPPESLIRFKCVCKSWYALINSLMGDSAFVAKHLANINNKISSSKSLLVSYTTRPTFSEPGFIGLGVTSLLTVSGDRDDVNDDDCIPCEIEDLCMHDRMNLVVDMVFHCNGIICLVVRSMNIIVLRNPAIDEFNLVPYLCLLDGFELLGVGFGYDSRTNDYKVVVVKDPTQEQNHYRAKVYNLSTNSWRDVTVSMEIDYFPSESQVVYCKGICYWYIWSWGVEDMIAFDFHDEVFRKILLPDNIEDPGNYGNENPVVSSRIMVHNESIALLFYSEEVPLMINMWMMDDSGCDEKGSCSWSKCITIGPIEGVKYPIAFWNDNDDLLMETEDGEIVSYSPSTQKVKKFPIDLVDSMTTLAVTCVKSLVSVYREGR